MDWTGKVQGRLDAKVVQSMSTDSLFFVRFALQRPSTFKLRICLFTVSCSCYLLALLSEIEPKVSWLQGTRTLEDSVKAVCDAAELLGCDTIRCLLLVLPANIIFRVRLASGLPAVFHMSVFKPD